jgi:hypothetical protein
VNEKVGLGITVANLQKYEIHMLAIRELGPPSELGHRLLECRASATHERVDGDLILCVGRRNTRIQPDNTTMSWMRYHIDGTDANFQRIGGGHGESLRGIWTSSSAFHNLAVSLAKITVWSARTGTALRSAGGGAEENKRLGETGFFSGSWNLAASRARISVRLRVVRGGQIGASHNSLSTLLLRDSSLGSAALRRGLGKS